MMDGKTKLELQKRIGNSWRDLADACEIPRHIQDLWLKGQESREILRYLDERGLSNQLPKKLSDIGRDDLSSLIKLSDTLTGGDFGSEDDNFPQKIKKNFVETTVEGNDSKPPDDRHVVVSKGPLWSLILGSAFGGLTLAYLMIIAVLTLRDNFVFDCNGRTLIIVVFSLGVSLSGSFLGGYAAANGNIPLPYVKNNPISVSVSGGVALLFILIVTLFSLYARSICIGGETPLVQ